MTQMRRHHILEGRLQGVGFRPFVFRLAREMGLFGWVKNSSLGVEIQIEGPDNQLRHFQKRLTLEMPPHGFIRRQIETDIPIQNEKSFEIAKSEHTGEVKVELLPDQATCPECVAEVTDPRNRRFGYAFTNCTRCGPRYSIMTALPYDRAHTTMASFQMCTVCEGEFKNPLDRRFHAQPNCCPACGPWLTLKNRTGEVMSEGATVIDQVAKEIEMGRIIAIQGIGGFHLVCDGQNGRAIENLRLRKRRPSKPFALMVTDPKMAQQLCEVSAAEEKMLTSAGAPIVLLKRIQKSELLLGEGVAPGLDTLGLMVPYSPFYHLLMGQLNRPLVVTSGNLSDEPICFEEAEALRRLSLVADFFVVHNRPIAAPLDDSVVFEIDGGESVIRAGRGYAPYTMVAPLSAPLSASEQAASQEILACGGQQKNTIAVLQQGKITLGPHIGKMGSVQADDFYRRSLGHLENVYGLRCPKWAGDWHPDYFTTSIVNEKPNEKFFTQHHVAHVLSCMADNQAVGDVLGVAWDGTGYGLNGEVWGAELFVVKKAEISRVGTMRSFRLPGGEKAIAEPRRSASGLAFRLFGKNLFEVWDSHGFSPSERMILQKILETGAAAPLASSMGRLFDGVASLCGLRQVAQYEGQAAMELEALAQKSQTTDHYEFQWAPLSHWVLDWEPVILGVLQDLKSKVGVEHIAKKFHLGLSKSIVDMARRVGINQVALTGGCFQNRLLLQSTIDELRRAGFTPLWHHRVPANDGGLSVGQILGGQYVFVDSGKTDFHPR